MLLNISNHPSTLWPEKQVQMANRQFGEIKDLSFPQIDPEADEALVGDLAGEYLDRILTLKPKAVHLMGELTFTFELVQRLKNHGISVLASTTHRISDVLPDGTKISKFEFVRFRQYGP